MHSKTFGSASSLCFCVDSLILGVSVVDALLNNHKTITYIHLFEVLSSEAKRPKKSFEPILIMTDFELDLTKMIALEVCSRFALLRPTGEAFTSCFSLLAKQFEKDLFSFYTKCLSKSSIAWFVNALPRSSSHTWCYSTNDERAELVNLFKYFNNYWIYQASQWNIYELSDKTNNYNNEGISTSIFLGVYA